MKLTFYSHYGVGDLFESREFAKAFMRQLGVDRADYAHRKLPGFFADIPEIRSVEVTDAMEVRDALTWRREGARLEPSRRSEADELWVNTWIGCRRDYVIWPGVGCVVENLYRMWNDLLEEAGLAKLPGTPVDYLPRPDYSRIDTRSVDEWLAKAAFDRLVLICNGKTGSGHAENFDMGAMLSDIPAVSGTLFLFTERFSADRTDVVFTDDITGRSEFGVGAYGPCDFNQIGYLSQSCSVIAGRCSGVQMATQTYANWMDNTKTLVCFTHHINGACFVREPEELGLKMSRVWSPAKTPAEAARVLKPLL